MYQVDTEDALARERAILLLKRGFCLEGNFLRLPMGDCLMLGPLARPAELLELIYEEFASEIAYDKPLPEGFQATQYSTPQEACDDLADTEVFGFDDGNDTIFVKDVFGNWVIGRLSLVKAGEWNYLVRVSYECGFISEEEYRKFKSY